jgi:hypothetical protein
MSLITTLRLVRVYRSVWREIFDTYGLHDSQLVTYGYGMHTVLHHRPSVVDGTAKAAGADIQPGVKFTRTGIPY